MFAVRCPGPCFRCYVCCNFFCVYASSFLFTCVCCVYFLYNTQEYDTFSKRNLRFHNLCKQPAYASKSQEEIRLEDYTKAGKGTRPVCLCMYVCDLLHACCMFVCLFALFGVSGNQAYRLSQQLCCLLRILRANWLNCAKLLRCHCLKLITRVTF